MSLISKRLLAVLGNNLNVLGQLLEGGLNYPVGGFFGYPCPYTEADASRADMGDATPTTGAELKTAVEAAVSGDVIWLDPDTTYDCTGLNIWVKAGVTIASNRGVNGSEGALVKTDTEYTAKVTGASSSLEPLATGGEATFVTDGGGPAKVLLTHSSDTGMQNVSITSITNPAGSETLVTVDTDLNPNYFGEGDDILIWGTSSANDDTHTILSIESATTFKIDHTFTSIIGAVGEVGRVIRVISDAGTYTGTYGVEYNNSTTSYLINTGTGARIGYTTDDAGEFIIEKFFLFNITGQGARFTGFRIQGPSAVKGLSISQANDASTNITITSGLCFYAENSEVDNCEIYNFRKFGILCRNEVKDHYFHHCHIHNCHQPNYGYGVWFYGNTGLTLQEISRVHFCIFHECRHNVAAAGGVSSLGSYSYKYNFEAEHTLQQDHSVDWHTSGGEFGVVSNSVFSNPAAVAAVPYADSNFVIDGFSGTLPNMTSLTVDKIYGDFDAAATVINSGTTGPTLTIGNLVATASNWHHLRPTVTLAVDDDLHSSPSGTVTFTATATDPAGGEIVAYLWQWGEEAYNHQWSISNVFTLSSLTTGMHIVHVTAQNIAGVLSRPSTVSVEVSTTALTTDVLYKLTAFWAGANDLTDSHVFSNTLTDDSPAVTYETGHRGAANTAFSFDGSTTLTLTEENSFPFLPYEDDLTVALAFQADGANTEGLFRIGGTDAFAAGIRLSIISGVDIEYNYCDGYTRSTANLATGLTVGKWYYIVFTLDRSIKTAQLWVGNITDTGAITSTGTDVYTDIVANATGYNNIQIAPPRSTGDEFTGAMSDIIFWRRKLIEDGGTTEISDLYNTAVPKNYFELSGGIEFGAVAGASGDYTSLDGAGGIITAGETSQYWAGEAFTETVVVDVAGCHIIVLPGFALTGTLQVTTDNVCIEFLGKASISGTVNWDGAKGRIKGRNNVSLNLGIDIDGNDFVSDGGGIGSVIDGSTTIDAIDIGSTVDQTYVTSWYLKANNAAEYPVVMTSATNPSVFFTKMINPLRNAVSGSATNAMVCGNFMEDYANLGLHLTNTKTIASGNKFHDETITSLYASTDDHIFSGNIYKGAATFTATCDETTLYANRSDGAVSDSGGANVKAANNTTAF